MCGKCGGLLLSKFKAHTWDDERGFLYNLKSCHFFAITHVYMAAPSRLLGLELLEMTSRLSNLIYSSLRSCQQSEQEYLPLIFRRALPSHQYMCSNLIIGCRIICKGMDQLPATVRHFFLLEHFNCFPKSSI